MIFKDRERYRQAVEARYNLSPDEMIAAERHGFRSWKNMGVGTSRVFANRSRIPSRYF